MCKEEVNICLLPTVPALLWTKRMFLNRSLHFRIVLLGSPLDLKKHSSPRHRHLARRQSDICKARLSREMSLAK